MLSLFAPPCKPRKLGRSSHQTSAGTARTPTRGRCRILCAHFRLARCTHTSFKFTFAFACCSQAILSLSLLLLLVRPGPARCGQTKFAHVNHLSVRAGLSIGLERAPQIIHDSPVGRLIYRTKSTSRPRCRIVQLPEWHEASVSLKVGRAPSFGGQSGLCCAPADS